MKRTATGLIAFLIVGSGITTTAGAASPNIEDGLWEMTIETRMEGLPIAMPPVISTAKQCLSGKDPVMKGENEKNCRIYNRKITGNKVSWEMECDDDGGKVSGKGEMTYSGSTCSGVTRLSMSSDGEKMTSTMKIKGRRIDKCPEGEPVAETLEQQEKRLIEMGDRRSGAEKETEQHRIDLLRKLKLPKETGSACVYLSNGETTDNCGRKWRAPLEEGVYETVEEEGAVFRDGAAVPRSYKKKTSRTCLAPDGSLASILPENGEVKRSGNTFTWKRTTPVGSVTIEEEGGIELKGNGFSGSRISRIVTDRRIQTYTDTTTFTRISGTLSARKSCSDRAPSGRELTGRELSGRELTGRAFSGTRKESETEIRGNAEMREVERVIKNPARKLRNMFGF